MGLIVFLASSYAEVLTPSTSEQDVTTCGDRAFEVIN